MPYKPYDPDDNWGAEYMLGSATGAGRGWGGLLGNLDYQQRQQEQLRRQMARPAEESRQDVRSPRPRAEPIFPVVDRCLERIPKRWFWMLGAVGACCGYGYAVDVRATASAHWYAIGGGLAGLLLIPAAALVAKLVLLVLAVGVLAGAGSLLVILLQHFLR
jgi:hypothetical protein